MKRRYFLNGARRRRGRRGRPLLTLDKPSPRHRPEPRRARGRRRRTRADHRRPHARLPGGRGLPAALVNPATGTATTLKNGAAHLQACLAEMKRLNIVKGVVSGGDGDRLAAAVHWHDAAPDRIIAAAGIRGSADTPLPEVDVLRRRSGAAGCACWARSPRSTRGSRSSDRSTSRTSRSRRSSTCRRPCTWASGRRASRTIRAAAASARASATRPCSRRRSTATRSCGST